MGNAGSMDSQQTDFRAHNVPLKLPMPEPGELEERFAIVLGIAVDSSNGTPVYLMDDFSEIIKCEERGLVHCVRPLLGVELHRMKITRPLPEVGKYTMIFHKRDQGNEVNIGRMNLLHQVSRVWRTDGLSSCGYKLLSVNYNPLYVNITVDFWSDP